MVEAGRGVVLGGFPELATVRIERHTAVVAPARAGSSTAVATLRAGAVDERLLALAERVGRIAGEPTGVLDLRVRGRVRLGVADGHVSRPVDGKAGHVAKECVRGLRVKRGTLHNVCGHG